MSMIDDPLKGLVSPGKSAAEVYRLGYDCGLNGANTTNCHFSLFSSAENAKEWERGKRDGEAARGQAEEGKEVRGAQ